MAEGHAQGETCGLLAVVGVQASNDPINACLRLELVQQLCR
jgi:hypothetical protein